MTINQLFDDIKDFTDLLEDATLAASTDWEIVFVSDISDKFEDQGENMVFSTKQIESLERIAHV